ncbi:MAG: DUF4112 domain-containing protein [Methanobacteriota archaeon]|jgi:hypothetical protein|nr:MAG: DUF4112 domain-containing protein [Euryarchaeota archaeon]
MNEEIIELNEEKLLRLKLLSERLDDSIKIPGTNQKIGIDAIVGIIPILGDFIGVIFSTYIMYSGIKMGVSSKIVKKMATNIAIEFVIGSIPIIGDIFDALWKANKRNVELIEEATIENQENYRLNYLIMTSLIVLILGLILVILGSLS